MIIAAVLITLIATHTYNVNARPVDDDNNGELYVTTINNKSACVLSGQVYVDGERMKSDNECEVCQCRPPGIACHYLRCHDPPKPESKECNLTKVPGECCKRYLCPKVTLLAVVVEDEADDTSSSGEVYNDDKVLLNQVLDENKSSEESVKELKQTVDDSDEDNNNIDQQRLHSENPSDPLLTEKHSVNESVEYSVTTVEEEEGKFNVTEEAPKQEVYSATPSPGQEESTTAIRLSISARQHHDETTIYLPVDYRRDPEGGITVQEPTAILYLDSASTPSSGGDTSVTQSALSARQGHEETTIYLPVDFVYRNSATDEAKKPTQAPLEATTTVDPPPPAGKHEDEFYVLFGSSSSTPQAATTTTTTKLEGRDSGSIPTTSSINPVTSTSEEVLPLKSYKHEGHDHTGDNSSSRPEDLRDEEGVEVVLLGSSAFEDEAPIPTNEKIQPKPKSDDGLPEANVTRQDGARSDDEESSLGHNKTTVDGEVYSDHNDTLVTHPGEKTVHRRSVEVDTANETAKPLSTDELIPVKTVLLAGEEEEDESLNKTTSKDSDENVVGVPESQKGSRKRRDVDVDGGSSVNDTTTITPSEENSTSARVKRDTIDIRDGYSTVDLSLPDATAETHIVLLDKEVGNKVSNEYETLSKGSRRKRNPEKTFESSTTTTEIKTNEVGETAASTPYSVEVPLNKLNLDKEEEEEEHQTQFKVVEVGEQEHVVRKRSVVQEVLQESTTTSFPETTEAQEVKVAENTLGSVERRAKAEGTTETTTPPVSPQEYDNKLTTNPTDETTSSL